MKINFSEYLIKFLKVLTPDFLKNIIRKTVIKLLVFRTKKRHLKALKSIKKKDKIIVAFFLIHDSVWKYECVYELLEQDGRFQPIVFVCPDISLSVEFMMNQMNIAFKNFNEKGYNVFETFDKKTNMWLDIKNNIKPDIVFFTNPHKLTKNEYCIENFLDTLTCYVPYGVTHTHLNEMQYNQPMHNLTWIYFVETYIHYEMAKKFSSNEASNVYVSGYPGYDLLLYPKRSPINVWKNRDKKVKKIIWAPHHTLDENKEQLSYSNFILFADFFLNLPQNLKDIQIAFKPHPLLKNKLYDHKDWGKEKTDLYYQKWNNTQNCQLNESDYIDLFLTSDAMIFDSGSFLNEYLSTNKPSLFLIRDQNLTDRFNLYGKMAFQNHYHGKNEQDCINFLKTVVLNNEDVLMGKRVQFINSFQKAQNGKTASENIYKFLLNKINT